MTCISPFQIQQKNGKWLEVPCGHCIPCRVAHSREWSTRLMCEKLYHKKCCFLTLTYDNEHLPKDYSLVPQHLSKFWKDVRNDGFKVKYYSCGEYGDKFKRPHYHAIVFGLGQEDENYIRETWSRGFVYCGTVTYDSCRYCGDYVMKKYNGKKKIEEYGDLEVPFQRQSKGIGLDFCMDNQTILRRDKTIFVRGQSVGLPRYFVKKLFADNVSKVDYLNAVIQRSIEEQEKALMLVDKYSREYKSRRVNTRVLSQLALDVNTLDSINDIPFTPEEVSNWIIKENDKMKALNIQSYKMNKEV